MLNFFKISRDLGVREKTRVCCWDAFKAWKLFKITRFFWICRNHSSPVNLAVKLWEHVTNSLVSVFLISERRKIWAEKKTRIQGTHLCHKLRNTLLKSQIIYCLNSGISLKNVGNTLLMYSFLFHSRSKFLLDKKKFSR